MGLTHSTAPLKAGFSSYSQSRELSSVVISDFLGDHQTLWGRGDGIIDAVVPQGSLSRVSGAQFPAHKRIIGHNLLNARFNMSVTRPFYIGARLRSGAIGDRANATGTGG
jgi:hypothetical protein